MSPVTAGTIAQSYKMFYVGSPDPASDQEMVEAVVLYPGYKPLIYQTTFSSSWSQLKTHCNDKGLRLYQVSTEVLESLTCEEFEAKWLHPNQIPLARDPLVERKLDGWYDDEGYAFCRSVQDDHVPPIYRLSREERDKRADNDLDTVRDYQADRKAQRLQAINEMAAKRRAGRARRKARSTQG